jgi:uncharacterized membrane protein YdjX (TVP38/TMEM64 family)
MKQDTETPRPPGRKIKWLEEGLLILGMLALSAGIAFMLYYFQDFFRVSLHSYGYVVYLLVFGVSLLSSSTIFIPTPGIAFTLAAAAIWDPLFVGVAAGTGDAIGEMTAYWTGYVGERIIVDEHMPAYLKAAAWMDRYGAWAIFGVALVPVVLFDLVGLAAGALKVRWWKFLMAAWCGKVPRAMVICYLGHQLPAILFNWHF